MSVEEIDNILLLWTQMLTHSQRKPIYNKIIQMDKDKQEQEILKFVKS